MTGDGQKFNINYRYDLITTVYGLLYWNRYHLRMLNLAQSRSFYVEFFIALKHNTCYHALKLENVSRNRKQNTGVVV